MPQQVLVVVGANTLIKLGTTISTMNYPATPTRISWGYSYMPMVWYGQVPDIVQPLNENNPNLFVVDWPVYHPSIFSSDLRLRAHLSGAYLT